MKTREKLIRNDDNPDGLDRRGFLECMAWAGTGMLWTVSSGLLGSSLLPSRAGAAEMMKGSFSFVQISDSHIGFSKQGINSDVTATLKEAIARINAGVHLSADGPACPPATAAHWHISIWHQRAARRLLRLQLEQPHRLDRVELGEQSARQRLLHGRGSASLSAEILPRIAGDSSHEHGVRCAQRTHAGQSRQ